jgi:hypothetical protein
MLGYGDRKSRMRNLLATVTTVDVLAVIGALCSLLMVSGSLYLFNRGILTLRESNAEEAIKVEFRKVLSIQSRNPAIALFIVGVLFLAVSFWFYEANPVRPIIVRGTVQGDDLKGASVNFSNQFGSFPIGGSEIKQVITPDMRLITVELDVPRHAPGRATADFDKNKQEISFGVVKEGDLSGDPLPAN